MYQGKRILQERTIYNNTEENTESGTEIDTKISGLLLLKGFIDVFMAGYSQ